MFLSKTVMWRIKIHIYALADIKMTMTMMFQAIKNAVVSLHSWNIYLLLWIYYRFFLFNFCARHGLKFNHSDSSYYVIAIEITFQILSKALPDQENIIMWMKQHAQTLRERSAFAAYFYRNSAVMANTTRKTGRNPKKKLCKEKRTNPFRKWHLWKCHWADVGATAERAASIFVCRGGTHDVESQKFCIFICCLCCAGGERERGRRATTAKKRKKHSGCRESWNLK